MTKATNEVTVPSEVQDQITKQTQFLGAIEELKTSHTKQLKSSRADRLEMVKALMVVVASAEQAGVELSKVQIAKAYGVHPSWITKAFKTSDDKELSRQYINGAISLLGVNRVMKTDKDVLIAEHASMVTQGKKPDATSLAAASGVDLDTCKRYLSEYLGRTLVDMSKLVVKQITDFCTFQETKDTGTVTDGKLKLVKSDIPNGTKISQLSNDLVSMIRDKKSNADMFFSVMKDAIGKISPDSKILEVANDTDSGVTEIKESAA